MLNQFPKSIRLFIFVLAASPTCAQTPPIEVGKVIDKVVVQSHPDQSYAAYLPKSYTPEKRWPTVFCLDPRARGRVAIDRFTEAAEQLGYIVLCSNNSRNGLDWQTISNIFTDFWDDAHTRFSIDEAIVNYWRHSKHSDQFFFQLKADSYSYLTLAHQSSCKFSIPLEAQPLLNASPPSH